MVTEIKKAVEMLFTDMCDIYETKHCVKDGLTEFTKEKIYSGVPCRISAKAYLFGENAAGRENDLADVRKKVKLFVPSDVIIAPGSIIEVTRLGQRELYKRSGAMMRYASHNEVMVENAKDWA